MENLFQKHKSTHFREAKLCLLKPVDKLSFTENHRHDLSKAGVNDPLSIHSLAQVWEIS